MAQVGHDKVLPAPELILRVNVEVEAVDESTQHQLGVRVIRAHGRLWRHWGGDMKEDTSQPVPMG